MTLTYVSAVGDAVRIQPLRKLTPSQDREIARLYRGGASADEIGNLYDVTRRTVYRAVARSGCPSVEVLCGGYKAWFVLTDLGPVQVTGWVAA